VAPLLFQAILWAWTTATLLALRGGSAPVADGDLFLSFFAGIIAGSVLAATGHPFRRQGLIPIAWLGLGIVSFCCWASPPTWLHLLLFGALVGLADMPLTQTCEALPSSAQAGYLVAGMAIKCLTIVLTTTLDPAPDATV